VHSLFNQFFKFHSISCLLGMILHFKLLGDVSSRWMCQTMNQCMGSGHGLFRVIEVYADGDSFFFSSINGDFLPFLNIPFYGGEVLFVSVLICIDIILKHAQSLFVYLRLKFTYRSLRASCKETVTLIFLCVSHFAIAACLLSAHFACPITRTRLCVSCGSVNYSIFQHELDLRGVHQYDILVILLFLFFSSCGCSGC